LVRLDIDDISLYTLGEQDCTVLTFCQESRGWADVVNRRRVAGEKRVRRRRWVGVRAVCHTSTRRLTTRSLSSQGACAARHKTQSTLKNDLEFRKIFIFLQTTEQQVMGEIYDF
jgi:hypothetical protein